jgi:DNA invertase Pin-like site-specific DNA recombinase
MSRIAYVRVSTVDQNPGRQFEALKHYGIGKYFEEKISGKDRNRPELKAMLDYVREGDSLYIESFSRLARSLSDLLVIVSTLQKRGVELISLKENVDTSTPAGRLQLHIFGALYEFERETIKERQKEGIDLALKEGRKYGRKKTVINEKFHDAYKRWKANEITAVEAMKLSGLKKTTFYKLVKEHEKIES